MTSSAELGVGLALALALGLMDFVHQSRRVLEARSEIDRMARMAFRLALDDPKHVYLVSLPLQTEAGVLSEGAMLMMDADQGANLKDAPDSTLVTMKILESKAIEDEIPAGNFISVSLKDLFEFDDEFRSKLSFVPERASAKKTIQ